MANEENNSFYMGVQSEGTKNNEDREDVSKLSVLSEFFAPKLSTIVEEDISAVSGSGLRRYVPHKRLVELAHPTRKHLEETLTKYGSHFEQKAKERIKIQIREQGTMSRKRSCEVGAGFHVPTNSKSQKIYAKLQTKLRKVAFDVLARKVFDKLPVLMLSMDRNNVAGTMTSDRKCLFETVHNSVISIIGAPTNANEERIFRHVCLALTKFVEGIIENVHSDQKELEVGHKTDQSRYLEAVELDRKAFNEYAQ